MMTLGVEKSSCVAAGAGAAAAVLVEKRETVADAGMQAAKVGKKGAKKSYAETKKALFSNSQENNEEPRPAATCGTRHAEFHCMLPTF